MMAVCTMRNQLVRVGGVVNILFRPFVGVGMTMWTKHFWYFIEKQYFASPHYKTSLCTMAVSQAAHALFLIIFPQNYL